MIHLTRQNTAPLVGFVTSDKVTRAAGPNQVHGFIGSLYFLWRYAPHSQEKLCLQPSFPMRRKVRVWRCASALAVGGGVWAAPKPFGPTAEFELGEFQVFCFACASPPRRSGAYGTERTYAPTPPHPYSAPHYGRHDILLARELRKCEKQVTIGRSSRKV